MDRKQFNQTLETVSSVVALINSNMKFVADTLPTLTAYAKATGVTAPQIATAKANLNGGTNTVSAPAKRGPGRPPKAATAQPQASA